VATWSKEELRKIAEADDLHIAPLRVDGVTCGAPTWIWSVAVDDALTCSAIKKGQKSRCYQAVVRQNGGRIITAGMTTAVTFESVDGPIYDRIDQAYRAKYRGSPYLLHSAASGRCPTGKLLRMNSSAPSETQSRPLSKAGSVLRYGAETAQIDR